MYKIIRIYYAEGKLPRTIKTGLTLEQAQKHCNDPKTRKEGVYFDAYEENMNKEEVWERVLALWKKLSETPDINLEDIEPGDYHTSPQSRFKNSILEELGYNRCEDGCPFCEEYYKTHNIDHNNCLDCPISFGIRLNCFNSPYTDWSHSITSTNTHRQNLAKKFYEWLKEIHEKV